MYRIKCNELYIILLVNKKNRNKCTIDTDIFVSVYFM